MNHSLKNIWDKFSLVEKVTLLGASALVAFALVKDIGNVEFSQSQKNMGASKCTLVCG